MTKIFCFGNTQNGELGLGGIEDEHILLPRRQKWSDANKHAFKQLAAGRNHSLILLVNQSGDRSVVLSCGSNERLQLAREGSWKRLEPIDDLHSHFVHKIACGANHSMALTEAGQLFVWGCNLFGQLGIGNQLDEAVGKPSLVKKLAAEQVVQIACGANHSLALTKCGILYAWGSNAFGQLGIGTKGNCVNSPVEVCFNSIPIRQISAGGSHSAILSYTGVIYVWGKNEFGQLGLNDTRDRVTPAVLASLRSQNICYVNCGEDHSAALTEDGGLFTWGAGMYGQLGHNKNSNEILPRRVFELMGNTVTQVSCGRCHTLVAIGANGRVFAFGLNGSGQLGIGTQVSKSVPIVVSRQWSELGVKDVSVRNIAGSLMPVFDNVTNISNQSTPRKARSPDIERLKKDSDADSTESDMSIDELNDENVSEDTDEDNPIIIEEPDDEFKTKEEPSFVCTADTILPAKEMIEIDEYLSDPDSNSEIFGDRYHYVLKEVVASKGDQSFVITSRLTEKTSSIKDFRVICSDDEIYKLNNSIIEQFKNSGDDETLSSDILDYVEHAFRSVNCWNASYIESCHKSESSLPLIDWSAATHGFHCIEDAENNRINDLILQSILSLISDLPNIYDNTSYDTEVLRIYILLPLFHMFRTGIKIPEVLNKLIAGYSRALLKLSDYAIQVLNNWWIQSDERYFKDLIKNCKKCVQQLLDAQDFENRNNQNQQTVQIDPQLHENLRLMLGFLALLHNANQKSSKVSYKEFYIEGIGDKFDVKLDYIYWLSTRARQSKGQQRNTLYLCDYPFIFDPPAKTQILATDSAIQQQNAAESSIFRSLVNPMHFMGSGVIVANPYLVISVSRNTLLQETIYQLCHRCHDPSEFKKPLKVNFEGEEAIDAGAGMKKEFFLLLMKEMLDPKYGMFNEYPDTNSIWFNPGEVGEEDDLVMYTLIGIVCGLAIYNQVIIYLPFPLALYKKILSEELTIDDLNSLDPTVTRNLKQILNPECSEEEFNEIYGDLNFTVTLTCYGSILEFELEKNGKEKQLNWNNRSEYVHLYWDYILNKSIEKQFQSFKQGFNKVLNKDGILQLFRAEELMQLVTGQDSYDWNVMEKCATEYKPPFNANHPTIIKFWNVFHILSMEEKKKFLLFLTGSDRIPILGMKALKIIIQPMKVSDEHLPVAHTCFNVLDLPENYSSTEKLKQKLLQAIEHTQGFALA